MNILLVEDHPVVRRGLKQILQHYFHDAIFGEASDREETMRELERHPWAVVVLDVSLPGVNGLDLLSDIKASCPSAAVMVLSMHPEEQFGVHALKAGAQGYLNKESAPEELVKGIETIVIGKRYISAALAAKIAAQEQLPADAKKGVHSLSNREFSVMRLLCEGYMIKEIGLRLDLSPKTVSTYRHRILEKLELTSNAKLIEYAITHRVF